MKNLRQGHREENRVLCREKHHFRKLLVAYIAQGGNPFDISMFLTPDSYRVTNTEGNRDVLNTLRVVSLLALHNLTAESYIPNLKKKMSLKGQDQRGWLPLWKFPPRKLGGNETNIYPQADEIGGQIAEARRWVRQEITQLRNDLEARIIKICDLREQLIIEKETKKLYNALVGSVAALEDFDPEEVLEENHLSYIVTNIDLNFFEKQKDSETRTADLSKPLPLKNAFITLPMFDDEPSGKRTTQLYESLIIHIYCSLSVFNCTLSRALYGTLITQKSRSPIISQRSLETSSLRDMFPSFLEHYKEGNTVVILDSYMEGTNILVLEEMVQFTQVGGNLLISPKGQDLQLVGLVRNNNKLIITYKK